MQISVISVLLKDPVLSGTRWARRGLGQDKEPAGNGNLDVSNDWEEASAAYSPLTLKSLDLVDENLLNYDLVEALVVHIVQMQSRHGPNAFLQVRVSSATAVKLLCECAFVWCCDLAVLCSLLCSAQRLHPHVSWLVAHHMMLSL